MVFISGLVVWMDILCHAISVPHLIAVVFVFLQALLALIVMKNYTATINRTPNLCSQQSLWCHL